MKHRALTIVVCCLGLFSPAVAQQSGGTDIQKKLRKENAELRKTVARQAAEIEKLKAELAKRIDPAPQPRPKATADGYPAAWVKSFEMAAAYRAAQLKELPKKIRQVEQKLKYIHKRDNKKSRYRKQLKELRGRHRELLRGIPSLPPLTELRIGHAGPLPDDQARVVEVISRTEMRAKVSRQTVLFRGVDTGRFADKKLVTLKGLFIVTGGGKREGYVVEPLDAKAWKAAYIAWKKSKKKP